MWNTLPLERKETYQVWCFLLHGGGVGRGARHNDLSFALEGMP